VRWSRYTKSTRIALTATTPLYTLSQKRRKMFMIAPTNAVCQLYHVHRGRKLGAPVKRSRKQQMFTAAYLGGARTAGV